METALKGFLRIRTPLHERSVCKSSLRGEVLEIPKTRKANLGLRVWGLGFRIKGLGFGV